MRFSLRSLLILMLIAGPLLAFGWTKYQAWREWRERQLVDQQIQAAWKTVVISPPMPLRTATFESLTPAEQAEVELLDSQAIVTRRTGGIVSQQEP